MPKHNGANSKKGKGQSKRASYTVEQRFYACHLKESGKSPKEIGTLLKEKYGLDLQSSTLSTFYNKKNMKKYKKECHRYSLMASGETSINKIQRPTILLDMEFVLVSMVKDSFNMGNVVPNPRLMEMGKDLFDRLRALRIHDPPGERLESFSDLRQDQINTLLDTSNTICPCVQR